MTNNLTSEQDRASIALIRGLAMDAPLRAKSGHQGTAMALAPLAHVLYSRVMKHDPSDPAWKNRDRFILSNGHASILQYAMLYLCGYGLEMDDLKNFRQWDSSTPGHPEVGHTVGVEVTTGPLGQGFANAVGMAIAESHLSALCGEQAMNHRTYVIAGDGCLMEGISHEAASLAGHLKLNKLTCIFDDNRITIDGDISLTCSDDVSARFRAYGWNVIDAGDIAEDCDAIEEVLSRAETCTDKPTLIVLRTHIGFPSPEMTDRHEAHGNPFTQELVSSTKAVMGIPDEPFWAPAELVTAYRAHVARRGQMLNEAWRDAARSEGIAALEKIWSSPRASELRSYLPAFTESDSPATRQSFQKVLDATSDVLSNVMAGAADLTGNTGAKISATVPYSSSHREGRQVYFGIREHAMGAALVGMALHGGVTPVGGTFFVFADYMRPSIRLAALSRARCVFVFSHDSVGVGEDGPTHQPVEQLASLRAIPGLQVIRPADANETAEAWLAAVTHDGPTALILSRQNLPTITDGTAVSTGAATIMSCDKPRAVLIGTGSEVSVALEAAKSLATDGIGVSVVSMPSWDRFLAQPEGVREKVLPPGVMTVSVEAGSTFGWSTFAQHSIGIDRFGASAPGTVVMENLGITAASVVALVKENIAE